MSARRPGAFFLSIQRSSEGGVDATPPWKAEVAGTAYPWLSGGVRGGTRRFDPVDS